MKVLLVEPPKDFWFIMGQYIPPPFGLLCLAAYVEERLPWAEVEVVDSQSEGLDWDGLEARLEEAEPDVVAPSGMATANAFYAVRTAEAAKKVNPKAVTVLGGQHFTALADETLRAYPFIDYVVRGEGEETFTELLRAVKEGRIAAVPGVSLRHGEEISHQPDRPLIGDLNTLPYPGYHLVKDTVHLYHFAAMGGRDAPYALVEGGRGCPHRCTFCTQWRHWCDEWRVKTPARIADEMEHLYNEYGFRFIWLTDDNFGPGERAEMLADELLKRDLGDDLMWFIQMRCDDVVSVKDSLPRMRRSGLQWVMMGVESPVPDTLDKWRKGIDPDQAREAVTLLKENDIFSHAMFVIGERRDTHESIEKLRRYVADLNRDFVIYTVLTPFPGTEIHEEAKRNGWIEDDNLFHYDMAHAVMGTEALTRLELQEELYECYRSFYGSWGRRIRGILSSNELKRRIYWYMAGKGILSDLKALF